MHKGPDWWVKIADFGISKRAAEGLTALRTLTGTPAFAAPEVLGFGQINDSLSDSYTNAVDIWSLGVITFLILTGETLFKDPRRLNQYVAGIFKFPSSVLRANNVSKQGCDFVKILMAPKSEDRISAAECLRHSWMHPFIEDAAFDTQRYYPFIFICYIFIKFMQHKDYDTEALLVNGAQKPVSLIMYNVTVSLISSQRTQYFNVSAIIAGLFET